MNTSIISINSRLNRGLRINKRWWLGTLAIAVAAGLTGCGNGDGLPVSVASLRETLPALEQAAALWRQDAYLVTAEVRIPSDDPALWVASAGFQSPSENSESLLVLLEQDGSVTSERVPHSAGVRQVRPIMSVDWKLDAEEALKQALTEEGRRYLEENSDSQCSFMYLERDVPTSIETVVWRVTLSGCLLDPAFQTTIVDANSGEILRRKTY